MNLIDLERLKVWLKVLFLLFALLLKHFRTFWRIQNSYLQLFCAKVAIRILMLMHIFIADYSPKKPLRKVIRRTAVSVHCNVTIADF
jgi:hypothetical protein